MRILLTGKNGQVGWELRRALAPFGEVVALERARMDLSSPDSIRDAIRKTEPDLIVNAAAYTAVDKAESEPDLAMAVNGLAPGIMAEEAGRRRALMVHYSTDYVFDGAKAGPYTEDDPTNPLSIYGKSKLAGEEAIRRSGCEHLILRTSWVYGARGKNFLLTMLRLAQERDSLRVVDDQVGAPTWSRMIAEATALILARLSLLRGQGRTPPLPAGKGWGEGTPPIFHLSASDSTTWHGFAQEIFRLGAEQRFCRAPRLEPIPTEQYPLPAPRPRNSRLSNDKLFGVYGIALPTWQAQLAMCIDEMSALRPIAAGPRSAA